MLVTVVGSCDLRTHTHCRARPTPELGMVWSQPIARERAMLPQTLQAMKHTLDIQRVDGFPAATCPGARVRMSRVRT